MAFIAPWDENNKTLLSVNYKLAKLLLKQKNT